MSSTARQQFLYTLLANLFLILLLFVGTWAMHGRVAAVRGGVTLAMPVGLVWLGFFSAFVWTWAGKRRALAIPFFGLFVLWAIVGGQTLMQWACRHVEPSLTAQPDPAFENRFAKNHFDAIVVLGGATRQPLPGFDEVGNDGERILSAAQAWHAGITETLIVTGSATHGDEHPRIEARRLLRSLGVPDDHIFELEGVNTSAEMKSLRQWIDSPPPTLQSIVSSVEGEGQSIGLITSAFHIPRAMRIATAEGLQLEPLPCAFRSKVSETPWSPADIIPTATRLDTLATMLKEMLARLAGQ